MLDSAVPVPAPRSGSASIPFWVWFRAVGDLVSPLFSAGIIWQARDLGIPRV
jgi:hypothetical protein